MSSQQFERRPSGLVVPMHAGIRGELHYRVLDERGVPEVPRNASGFAIGPVEGITQHNLLTNAGMDAIGTVDVLGNAFRNYFHVGTDSTAPVYADAALGAEAQRSTGGSQQPVISSWDENYGPAGYIDYFYRVGKSVTMSANRNLTEFGFGSTNDTAVYIRELFRDGGGNPTTVSLLNGKVLDVVHTLQFRFDAPADGKQATFDVERYDAANNLISSTAYDYTYGPRVPSPGGPGFLPYMSNAWNPMRLVTDGNQMSAITSGPVTYSVLGSGFSGGASPGSWEAYVPGSHQKVSSGVLPTNQAVGNIFSIGKGPGALGYIAALDSPASFAKSNAETLEFTFISSWSRL